MGTRFAAIPAMMVARGLVRLHLWLSLLGAIVLILDPALDRVPQDPSERGEPP